MLNSLRTCFTYHRTLFDQDWVRDGRSAEFVAKQGGIQGLEKSLSTSVKVILFFIERKEELILTKSKQKEFEFMVETILLLNHVKHFGKW